MVNLFIFAIENLSLYTQNLVRQSDHVLRRFMESFEVVELFDAVSDKLAEHPILRFMVFTSALGCTIPVVMFILFGIMSVILTFAGFLLIEGTLLAVGGLCMSFCMAMMILVLSILTVTIGCFYTLTLKVGYILKRFKITSVFQNQTTAVSNLRSDNHHD